MIRWGIAGPGGIATRFAEAMELVEGGTITAVASRSKARADAFGDRFGATARYGDYESLAADPDVDAVYVATPHSRHEADTLRYLGAGKHVLCEKAFALNAAQGQRMVDEARARGLFLMEAIWSRFLPSYLRLGELLAEGAIGEPLLVEADFGMRMPFDAAHRLFDPLQGGGALLDLGIYPVQLCSLVLGPPEEVVASGTVGETGVDELVVAVLRQANGSTGIAKAALNVGMACAARISGTSGWIDLPAFHHCPVSLSITSPTRREQLDAGFEGDGLRFEIDHVHRCLAEGRTESPVMPLDETLSIARTLDTIRAQLGVVYPGE